LVCFRVIINDSLDAGSQMPWVEQGVKEGYAVLLMNPNCDAQEIAGRQLPVTDGTVHFSSLNFYLLTSSIAQTGPDVYLRTAVHVDYNFWFLPPT